MGVYKELQKLFGSSVHNYVIAARTAQGYEDWRTSSSEDRLTVVRRWHEIQSEILKEKQEARPNSFAPQVLLKSKRMSCDGIRKSRDMKKLDKKDRRHSGANQVHDDNRASSNSSHHARTFPDVSILNRNSSTFEEAIQTSVAATSQGDSDQDRMIERAIRASVRELQSASREGDNGEAVARAIKASVAEATRAGSENATGESVLSSDDVDDRKEQLRLALHSSLSMQDEASSKGKNRSLSGTNFDDSDIDTSDDENIKTAIHQSQYGDSNSKFERTAEYQKALEESRKTHEKHEVEIAQARANEETMLEHVKNSSLMNDNN